MKYLIIKNFMRLSQSGNFTNLYCIHVIFRRRVLVIGDYLELFGLNQIIIKLSWIMDLECKVVNINLLDYDACTQYHCTLKENLIVRKDECLNLLTKENLTTHDMWTLFCIFLGRKEINKKLKYDESFDKEIHPY